MLKADPPGEALDPGEQATLRHTSGTNATRHDKNGQNKTPLGCRLRKHSESRHPSGGEVIDRKRESEK